jgi:hypothetical protein
MPLACLRLSALGVAGALLAGCGGGSAGNPGGGGGTGGNSSPTTVTFQFEGPAPTAVAARTGSGPFKLQALTSGVLNLSVPAGTTTFAVAYVCPTPAEAGLEITEQVVHQLSVADGTTFTETCAVAAGAAPGSGGTTGPSGILTGSVDASAISGASLVNIYAQNGSSAAQESSLGVRSDFSFSAPAGNDRVLVLAYSATGQGLTAGSSLVAARNFPSQTVPGVLNGGNTVALGAADLVSSQPITYSNLPSGYSAPSTTVVWGGGGGAFVIADHATSQYPALPAGAVQSGDRYGFSARSHSSAKVSEAVSVNLYASEGGPLEVRFPPSWAYGGPAPAALPAFDFSYAGMTNRGGVFYIAYVSWPRGSTAWADFLVGTSASAVNGSTVVFPDLSGLPGFLAPPGPGTDVAWGASIMQTNWGQASSSFAAVENSGEYTVP